MDHVVYNVDVANLRCEGSCGDIVGTTTQIQAEEELAGTDI